MENRKGQYARSPEVSAHAAPIFLFPASSFPSLVTLRASGLLSFHRSRFLPIFYFLISIFFLCGCGAPGDPVPPSPPVAVAVSDLAAKQSGDGVELIFTLPSKSVSGEKLMA